MTKVWYVAALLAAGCVAGCQNSSDSQRASFGDALGTRFNRDNDTNGSQRRVDVYGGSSTAPVLPTIGASGFGK